MRRALIAGSVFAAILAACADLFHDTDFAFELRPDASLLAETSSSAVDGAVSEDFCALPIADGKALAVRSCALLAACQSPFGSNATGRCLARAIPAMACKGAPGSAVRGPVLAFYRCLARAKTCGDIERCVFPVGVAPQCGSAPQSFTQCGLAKDGQDAVRIDCPRPNAVAVGEACAAYGKRCDLEDDSTGFCTGQGGVESCMRTGCVGTQMQLCRDGGSAEAGGGRDDGFDCANFGAGKCVDGDAGPACLPSSNVTCVPSADVECNVDGVAVGCPAGRQELVDCRALFGSQCHAVRSPVVDAGASKDAGDAGNARERTSRERAWDVQRACEIVGTDAAACTEERCNDKKLVACVRGSRIVVDCAALFGTDCTTVETSDGLRPACRAPR